MNTTGTGLFGLADSVTTFLYINNWLHLFT